MRLASTDGVTASAAVAVTEQSQVGEARRLVTQVARRSGFDEVAEGNAAIVVTEAATNLLKHAGGGEILVRQLEQAGPDGRRGLEVLALDRGPGIRNLAECLRDGYSTAGSPGTGLGAIRRLSTTFDVYSAAGLGTALVSRLWPRRGAGAAAAPASAPVPPAVTEIGAVCVAQRGEEAPGDGWALEPRPRGFRLLVVDGLGHGPLAHEAALAAVDAFRRHPHAAPAALVEACHAVLAAKRGAALAVAEVDLAAGAVRYAGVGNIMGVMTGPAGSQHLVSMNGTVGHGTIRPREFTYAWAPGSLLVMCSDGLTTRWSLGAYPGLPARHPSLVAGVLWRDHARGRDDATVVAVREGPRREGAEGPA